MLDPSNSSTLAYSTAAAAVYSFLSTTAVVAASIGLSRRANRGFGEHITRVTVAGTRQTYDVAALRETKPGHRRDVWLYITRDRIRVITSDEKRAYDSARPRPNQTMQPTALRRYASVSSLTSVIQPAAICAFQSGG